MLIWTTVEALLCCLIAAEGVRRTGALRIILIGQSIFWLLAFVFRPIYLVIAKPSSYALLADPRLVTVDYKGPIDFIMSLVVLATAVYWLTILILGRFGVQNSFARLEQWRMLDRSRLVIVAAVLWAIGAIGRLLVLLGLTSLESALDPFAIAGGALLIVFVGDRVKQALPLLVAVLVLVELLWSFSSGSKQDFLIPLLALIFRWFAVPGARRPPWRLVAVVAGLVLVGFFSLQALRGISNDIVQDVRIAATGSTLLAFGILLLERFDGFSAYVDAVYVRDVATWLSPPEYLGRVVYNLVPKGPWLPASEGTLGQLWTREVRTRSFGDQYQDVSLAASFGPEGYAVGGVSFLIVVSVVFALIVHTVGRAFDSARPVLIAFAAPVLFAPAMYEQGILGLAGLLNKGVQVALVTYLLWIVVGQLRSRSPRVSNDLHSDLSRLARGRLSPRA